MIKKNPSPRNRTLTVNESECKKLLKCCLDKNSFPADSKDLQNKIICGDFFEIAPFLPENFADLVIADPPYNMHKSFNGNVFSQLSEEKYAEYTRKWLALVKKVLKPDGSIYICCDWKSSLIIGNVLQEFFTLRNRITWQREKGRGAKANWKNSSEDIFFATAGNDYKFNLQAVKQRRKVLAPYKDNGSPKDWQSDGKLKYRDTCPGNFWDDITVPFWSMPENTAHPTQKPEKLFAKLILAGSDPGDLIFDPFAGSGTSCVTAKKLNRNYTGIEIDPLYCSWCEKRLQNASNDPEIQGFYDGVFWERNSAPQQSFKKGDEK